MFSHVGLTVTSFSSKLRRCMQTFFTLHHSNSHVNSQLFVPTQWKYFSNKIKHKKMLKAKQKSSSWTKPETNNKKYFMLQLRVIRAFKSQLEDLDDRRSIHSLRSNRNAAQSPAMANFFSNNKAAMFRNIQHPSTESSPSGDISIPVPTLQSPPLNLNDYNINARFMDDDGPSSMDERSNANANGQSKETRI